MNSSYLSKLDFGDLIKVLTFINQPKKIVEFGILNGFSLKCFVNNSSKSCSIDAYDIFEDFNGNSADYNTIINLFKKKKNVNIKKYDYYNGYNLYKNKEIDLLHIDIANNGDVYKFAIDNYMEKLSDTGIMILEGGSIERDNVEWMLKYKKTPINPYLQTIKDKYNIITINKMPSITIITKKV